MAVDMADCHLQSGGESTVMDVSGPQTLHLADGRYIRLAEILVPGTGQPGPSFDPSTAAVTYLRTMSVGRKVEVKFGGAQRDRYGVYMGHVYVSGDRPLWLQEGLVDAGLAQVAPQADNRACSRRLASIEVKARDEKRGHWGLAYFKVLKAADPRSMLSLVQTYQIVEGKVDHASESGSRVTLHFSPDNRFGFTAILEPGARKRLAEGFDAVEGWDGRFLRIRGWMDRRRGPSISVAQPEQVEFLSQPGSATNR